MPGVLRLQVVIRVTTHFFKTPLADNGASILRLVGTGRKCHALAVSGALRVSLPSDPLFLVSTARSYDES